MKKLTSILIISAALLSTSAIAEITPSKPAVDTVIKFAGSSGIQLYDRGLPLISFKSDLFLTPQLAISTQLDSLFILAQWISLGAIYFIEPTGNGFFAQANIGYVSFVNSEPYGEFAAGYRMPINTNNDFIDLSGNFQAYTKGDSTFNLRIMYGKTLETLIK